MLQLVEASYCPLVWPLARDCSRCLDVFRASRSGSSYATTRGGIVLPTGLALGKGLQ